MYILKKANLHKEALNVGTLWSAFTKSKKRASRLSNYIRQDLPNITKDPALIKVFDDKFTKAKKQKKRFMNAALTKVDAG